MQDKQLANRWQRKDLWKGLAAGLVGGLVASWTVNRFQDLWSKFAKGIERWPKYDFQNVWSEFGEGLEKSSDAQPSKPGPSPQG